MKRRIIALAILIVLMVQISPVYSDAARHSVFQVCSGYWSEDLLRVYAQLGEYAAEEQKVTLTADNAHISEEFPASLSETGEKIRFTILVNASTSMPGHHAKIVTVIRELMESAQNLVVTLEYFGKERYTVAEDMTEWSQLRSALGRITYGQSASDIAGNVAAAVKALGELPYSAEGEMRNLLVITDGEPWYAAEPEKQAEQLALAESAAKNAMEAYPEVLIHTYQVGSWEASTLELLTDTKGVHTDGSPQTAGAQLMEYVDNIYSLSFPLPGYSEAAYLPSSMYLMIGRSMAQIGSVRNVDNAAETENAQTEPEETADPTDTTEPVITDPTDATAPDASDPTGDDNQTEETSGPRDETDDTSTEKTDNGEDKDRKCILWCLAGAGVLAVILAAVLLLVRCKKNGKSIRMRIELVSGTGVTLKRMYRLERELLIGTGRDCDIRITDGYAQISARIFLRNQVIFVEDLGTAEHIQLNRMRLFSSNRLRSGDELTVGNVVLRIQF